jgi:hypothetical protein
MQAIAMNHMRACLRKFAAVLCFSLAFSFFAGAQTNSLVWRQAAGRVDASVHNEALLPLLKNIAAQSGWHVYVEPGTTSSASTKFKNLPVGDALRMLLGDLNFALVPKVNAPSQLFVFRTTMKNATHLVAAKTAKHVPNQLTVKVKPGTDIDALAKSLGAKVIGRMDKYGTYLLQFGSDDATDAALAQLQMDSNVQAVDYNYNYDPPPTPEAVASGGSAPQMPLTLNPPPSSGKVIVGLIDTAINEQSLGADADQFMLPQISVADGSTSDSGPTHADAMAPLILQAIANSTGSSGTSVQILPVNVYGSSETTTSWDVAEGVQAAVNAGATVLNLSLGSDGDSEVLQDVLQQAARDGITSFGAAGNTPIDAPYYPAADPGVIAVTALAQPGQLASYANSWSDSTMLALPGTGSFNYDNSIWTVQGTSTATAISSGIFSGNMAMHGWTQQQTVSAMESKFPVPLQ